MFVVMKFGGTSVASAENIRKVIQIVKQKSKESKLVVVVSALSGITDLLLNTARKAAAQDEDYLADYQLINEKHQTAAQDLIPNWQSTQAGILLTEYLNQLQRVFAGVYNLGELSPRTLDKVGAYGELLSSVIITEAMQVAGLQAVRKDSRELIITDETYLNAKVDFDLTNQKIQAYFQTNSEPITILPGFVSSSLSGITTTLGRGGSDYTASILAAALDASVLEIWTDVSGIYTTNPKIVSQAKPIANISYQEAMELSHFGAKVIYPPTIQPVLAKNIPTWIKNTFEPEALGSLICNDNCGENEPIKGISHIENMALITLEGSGMVGVPGFSKRLFGALAEQKINVILITQASSEHSICIGINQSDVEKAQKAVNNEFEVEINRHKIEPLQIEQNLAIIAVVGDNMRNHQGISGKLFGALGRNNVNVRAIAQGASERNISVVITQKDVKKALNTVHEAFFEQQIRHLHLFVVGVGNVGSKLLAQIKQQQAYLLEKMHLNIKVVGISNSKNQYFNKKGIDLNEWQNCLAQGEPANLETFFAQTQELNLRNSILVDNTASEIVAGEYERYLQKSISVVTCNKIACASQYTRYANLKRLSRKYGASFFFETNVGAGLPVIGTLNNLVDSGDQIQSIQAVVSGSLNFIFNNYQKGKTFYEVVKQAQTEGYTEPDPRIDLSGVDVMRKILILARESGAVLELEDIDNQSFLPPACQNTESVAQFLANVKENESFFENMRLQAEKENCQLKYVAEFTNGKARTSLKQIPAGHPFYNLAGKDNIVLFYTTRYPEQPLLVRGAGAGADVTASGIFADIIRVSNE
jgi:aspartokinase/homoserine dehydrogenase 1